MVEFAYWVGAVTGIVVGFALAIGLLFGGDLIAVKSALFVVGSLLAGVGVLGLQPKRPHKDKKRVRPDAVDETRIEKRIQEIPPLAGEYLPFEARVGRSTKLFVTGLVVLAISLFMEVGLGIAVGPR